jgi:hypothetical protein
MRAKTVAWEKGRRTKRVGYSGEAGRGIPPEPWRFVGRCMCCNSARRRTRTVLHTAHKSVTVQLPFDVRLTMVERSDSFGSVADGEDLSVIEELLLPSSDSSLTEPAPPHLPSSGDDPMTATTLEPSEHEAKSEAAPRGVPQLPPALNTTTTTTTTSSVSDEPEDLEANPETQPPPTRAEVAADGDEKEKAKKRFIIRLVKVGAVVIGLLVAGPEGGFVGFVVSHALLRLLQLQSAQSQSGPEATHV